MDVRCERCRAQYVFDDEQVTASGLAVQCTNCGHLFKVKKKELVVTVPVKPGDLDGPPLAAGVAAPPPVPVGVPERAREWRVRQASGDVLAFGELTTLQKWIVERKVSREDEISAPRAGWRRLGAIPELATFFEVVDAADRGRAGPRAPPLGACPPPPSGYPPPAFTLPPVAGAGRPPAAGSTRSPEATGAPLPVRAEAANAIAATGRRGRRRALAVAALLVLVLGVGALAVARNRSGIAPAAAVAPVAAVGASAAPPPAPEAAASGEAPLPVARPEPVEAPTPAVPEPPLAAPARRKGPRTLLAEAQRLRERGQLEKALDAYGRVATDDPENAEALTGRGLCYLDLSRYPPAEASFEAALELDPRQADALLGLAETYRWQGRKAQAIKYYEQYLAEHPDGDEAAVARNAIGQLRE